MLDEVFFFLAGLLTCTKSFTSLFISCSRLVYFSERNLCHERPISRLLTNMLLFSFRELKWMLMTSSGCIHYSWTKLAPASFLKNTRQNSCSTKKNHPSPRLKPWRLRPGMIDKFPIPVYIACSMLFLDLSISCAALVNFCKQTQ